MLDDVEIFTVDRLGGNAYSHADAYAIQPIHEELNEPGSFAFAIPNDDPFVGNARVHAREAQVWRKGQLKWQGKIQRRGYDPETNVWNIYCEGPLKYFEKLKVGRAGRVNHLVNGSFDAGNLSSWNPIGVTANVVTEWGALPGTTYQANLYQAGSGQDTFIEQMVVVPGGTYWTLSGYFHIRTDSQWAGPALDNRGLYIERRHPTTNVVEDVAFAQITDDTQRGIFQRVETNMESPPDRDSIFWIRLYATRCTSATGSPPGSIIWDDIQLVAPESLSYSHVDVASVVDGLVSHAQDPAFDKVYLGIDTPGAGGPTGILVDRYYQFDDHTSILDALHEFTEAGICDIQCVTSWDHPNQKAVRHIVVHTPRQGEFKALALELDAESSISKLTSIESDGDKTVTTALVQGDGSGPSREEASASDTSLTDGVVIEETLQAPSGTHHDLLKGIAAEQVAKLHGVSDVPALVLSPDMTDLVNVGDTFPTTLDLGGPLTLTGNYRVIASDLDLYTDQLTIQVVEA